MLGNREADDRVARLVIGGELLLFLGHRHGAALGTHHDLVLGILEFVLGHEPLVAPRSQQCRLVDEVGEVGAGEAGRAPGDDARIDVGRRAARCACGP